MNLYVCHPLGGPNNASVPKTAWHRIVRESFPRDDHAVVTLEDKRVVAFLVNAKGLSLVNSCLSASEALGDQPEATPNDELAPWQDGSKWGERFCVDRNCGRNPEHSCQYVLRVNFGTPLPLLVLRQWKEPVAGCNQNHLCSAALVDGLFANSRRTQDLSTCTAQSSDKARRARNAGLYL